MTLLEVIGVENFIPQIKSSLTVYIAVTLVCFLSAIIVTLCNVLGLKSPDDEPKACQKLQLRSRSNLTDEHNERYSTPEQRGGDTTWSVKSLWVYPVKSCTGIELNGATVTGMGMEYDRKFCFAQLTGKFPARLDDSKQEKGKHVWKFITQRSIPAMARIKTEIWVPEPSSPTYSRAHPNVESDGVLVIRFPSLTRNTGLLARIWNTLTLSGRDTERIVHIPFNPSQKQISAYRYTTEDMEIWKDSPASLVMASTEGPGSWTQELRSYLGITNHLALFRLSTQPREVYRCAPRRDQLGYQPTVGFQDAYPLHILNLASVHDVARNMVKGAPPLGARNFRPNIIVTGGEAYAEDSWKRIRIGNFEYYVACRTVRCLLPNVNPATGVRHGSEPNRTLKSFRRIDEGDPNNACLGMQMVPALEGSKIEVGDKITLLETGEHLYIKQ